jgi:hypothetical protein
VPLSPTLLLLVRTLVPALASSARPATTFALIDATAAILVRRGHLELPPALDWLVGTPVVAFAVILAILETLAAHDDDVAAIARELHFEKVASGLGALASGLGLAALGDAQAAASIASRPDETVEAIVVAGTHSGAHSDAVRFGALACGVGGSVALAWLRGKLLDALDEVSLSGLWARLETGGVVALVLLLVALPAVALALCVAGLLALTAASIIAATARRVRDLSARSPCPSCRAPVRHEASLCPRCRTGLSPRKWLGTARPRPQ